MNLPLSRQKLEEMRFAAYCIKVLKTERKGMFQEDSRKLKHENLFSELDDFVTNNISTTDSYDFLENSIQVMEFVIYIENDMLFDVLSELPSKKRDVILLSYWMNLSDVEIAKALKMTNHSVGYHKKTALEKMRTLLRGNANV